MKKRAVAQRGLLKAVHMDRAELGQLGLHRYIVSGQERAGGSGDGGRSRERRIRWQRGSSRGNGEGRENTLTDNLLVVSTVTHTTYKQTQLDYACSNSSAPHHQPLPRLQWSLL